MRMRMPYAQVWNIVPLDVSGSTPPYLFYFPYETTAEARAKNLEALKTVGKFREPVMPVARSYTEKVGLKIDLSDPRATTSKLAVLAQTPKVAIPIAYDQPGVAARIAYHGVGEFTDFICCILRKGF